MKTAPSSSANYVYDSAAAQSADLMKKISAAFESNQDARRDWAEAGSAVRVVELLAEAAHAAGVLTAEQASVITGKSF